MTVARTRKAKADAAAVNELNPRPAAQSTLSTEAPAPAPAPSPSQPVAASAAPSQPASPSSDPFASVAPGGPTLFEAMDGPRPRRWLIAADGIGVAAAWDAWRVAEPTGTPDAFVAQLGRALGDAPEAVTALSVVRVRLRRGSPSSRGLRPPQTPLPPPPPSPVLLPRTAPPREGPRMLFIPVRPWRIQRVLARDREDRPVRPDTSPSTHRRLCTSGPRDARGPGPSHTDALFVALPCGPAAFIPPRGHHRGMTDDPSKPPAAPVAEKETAAPALLDDALPETPTYTVPQVPPALKAPETPFPDAKGGSYAPESEAHDDHADADPTAVPESDGPADESGAEATDEAPVAPSQEEEPPFPADAPAEDPPAPSQETPGAEGPAPLPTDDEVREEVARREREMRWRTARDAIGTALIVAPGIAGQAVAGAMDAIDRLMSAFFSGGPMAVGSRIFAEALSDADTAARLAREAHSAYGIAENADREALKGTYKGRMLEARTRAEREGIARAHLWMARQAPVEEMDHASLDRLSDAMRARRAELARQAREGPGEARRAALAEIACLDDVEKGIRSRRSALRSDEREERDRAARERTARYDEAYDAIEDPEDIRRIAMDARGRRDIDWTDTDAGPVPSDPAEGRRVAAALQDRAAVLREQGDREGSERLAREAERIALASETPAARAAREQREARDAQRESDRAAREEARAQRERARADAERAEADRRGAMPPWQVAWEDESRRVGRGTPSWGEDGLPTSDLPSYSAYALRMANSLPDGEERDAWLDRADAADLRRIVNSIDRNGDIARSDVNADRAAILIDRHLADAGFTPEVLAMEDGGKRLAAMLADPSVPRETRALVRNRLVRDAKEAAKGMGSDEAVRRWLKEAMADGGPEGFARLRPRIGALREGRRLAPTVRRHAETLGALMEEGDRITGSLMGHALGPDAMKRMAAVRGALGGLDPVKAAERGMTAEDLRTAVGEAGALAADASKAMGAYKEGIGELRAARATGDAVKAREARAKVRTARAALRGIARPDPLTGRSRLDAVEASLGLPGPIAASASSDRATALRIAGRAVLASRLGVPVDARLVKSAETLLRRSLHRRRQGDVTSRKVVKV